MQTHRHMAKRKALFWQVGAVALLGAAGAAIALPQIRSLFAPPTPPNHASRVDDFKPAPPDYSGLPFAAMADGARSTGPAVMPVVVAPIVVTAPPVDTTPPPPPATDWAYLGSIITQTKRSALVRVDGQQQIYSVGSTHGDAKLVTIETGYIELELGTDKEKKKITLNERTMLTPTEPPKHPVAFRQPPAMGGPGAGAAMNFNTAMNFNSAAGRGSGGPPAATMDQQRMAALAAAEAAARAKQPMEVPGMPPLERINPGDVEAASKYLSDPTIGDESRSKYLQMLGIGRGTAPDVALGRLKDAGVDLSSEAGKILMQAVENNSHSKP